MSYSGKYARFSHEQQGFDSLHRRFARPLVEALHAKTQIPCNGKSIAASALGRAISQSMLVHGRGSYPRIGWFDSIDCDETTRSLVEALHATRRCPFAGGVSKPSPASTLERWSLSVGVVQRSVLPSLQRTTRVRFPSPILSRSHSSKPYTHAARHPLRKVNPRGFDTRMREKFSLARRGASGEAMTNSANRASVRSFGANERWVRVPPPRLS